MSLFAWPPKCDGCGVEIRTWGESGVSRGKLLHKTCWLEAVKSEGHNPGPLTTPLDAIGGGMPMILFLLLFHAGGGASVMGWFMLNRYGYDSTGVIVLVSGLVSFCLGLGGFAVEILLRMRGQSVLRELESQGGWQPPEIES